MCICVPPAEAYVNRIGLDDLIAMIGSQAVPNGAGVKVAQVEAAVNGNYAPFLPDDPPSEFTGKTLTLKSGASDVSGHATSVAYNFYRIDKTIADGITEIDSYNADTWLGADFLLATGSSLKPRSTDARLANHSWIVSTPSPDPSLLPILKRLDWVVMNDDFIQIAGESNGGTAPDVNAASFNAIIVGRTNGTQGAGTADLDSTYVAGRAKPDIVAPSGSTSGATPIVSSVAAALIQFAHENPTLSLSRTATSANRAGLTIYQAESSETIKAVLMAGAERRTYNRVIDPSDGDITNYRIDTPNLTTNGLDLRFGAGQVNIFHSYNMLAAGQTDSTQDGGSGAAGAYGYDYDEHFGGSNTSNAVASYTFTARPGANLLTSTLAWNLYVNGGTGPFFNGATTLYDLDLKLFDLSDASTPVAMSASTIDNTENLRTALVNGHSYELRVTADTTAGAFDWDYALGWRLIADHGDWDHDADIDAADIDLVAAAIGSGDLQFDLNVDGVVDRDDLNVMVDQLVRTPLGDANLDGTVDIADLVRLSQNYSGAGGWAQGDFNGDGVIDIADLVILSSNYSSSSQAPVDPMFGYSDAAALAVALADGGSSISSGFSLSAIPEPAASFALLCGVSALGWRRRGSRC